MTTRLARLSHVTGIDFHVAITLLFRTWSVASGGIMVLCVPLWFSLITQGYYYTFSSLVALQVFFELGMNQVVVQIVGHEIAHLTWTGRGVLAGDEHRLNRLTSLAQLLRKWYFIAAVLFFAVVSVVGAEFFARRGELPVASWLGPWLALVFFSALNLYLSPSLAVMEGCGQIGQVARLRLYQSMTACITMWIALSLGFGLWAIPIIPAITSVFTFIWLNKTGTFLRWIASRPAMGTGDRISWRKEIFPFQWRVALSWISGYFILQLFTPLAFSEQGAAEAGRLGIALSIFSAILTLGMSWINAKIPTFVQHIARHERSNLNVIFLRAARRSVAFTALAVTTFIVAAWIVSSVDGRLLTRIASFPVLIAMGITSICNSAIFAAAAYMRAHREEPLLGNALVTGLMVAGGAYVTSKSSVILMMSTYSAIILFVSLPWVAWLFLGYYRRVV